MTPPLHRLCRGRFIVFEGIDGAGKTTQIPLLARRLRQAGYDVVCLKEPTEGVWGQKLRQLARDGRHTVAPATELEWFLADRREDVTRNIQPALAHGQIVLLDRYYFSTMAYQGALHFDPEEIRLQNEAFAPQPDLLLLLDVPVAQGVERVQQRGVLSDFERSDYLERVAACFATMQFPYLRRINAAGTLQDVHAHIWQAVTALLTAEPAADREDTVS